MTIQGALTDLRNLLNADDIPCYYKPSIKKIIETIEQEPKTGHWIHTEECDEEWQYRCSKCNMPSRSNSHRYCSNCGSYMYGAKMESEDKE